MAFKSLNRVKRILMKNPMIFLFIFIHTTFAIFLGRLFALAPDEIGYIYTFNNVYSLPISTSAQTGSGWITAPTVFLWIAYLPAKILNMIGVPDYLSIRILSILLATTSLSLLLGIRKRSQTSSKYSQKLIFAAFFIPSVFLWTSVGLRESFIIAEITAFLVGFNYLIQGKEKRGALLLFIGSYGLISTKNYLWACLMVALILSSVLFLFQGIDRRKVGKFALSGLLVPVILFASTTSAYAWNFILHSDISETGARSGDSISQIYVEVPGTGTGTGPAKELITFHGDYTLIALHFYVLDNPNSIFSKFLNVFHLDNKIQSMWDEKVQLGLISEDKQVGTDTSSLNGHILKPGIIGEPLSMLLPALIFLFGPIPFIGDPGIAVGIAALESPMWWVLYSLVIFQLVRYRRLNLLRDPPVLFTLVFFWGLIAFSSLVEVNLGTSFCHRSIILVPLVFIYLRLAQKAEELKTLKSSNTI